MALTENGAIAAIRIISQMINDEELAAALFRNAGEQPAAATDLLAAEPNGREAVL